MYNQVIDRTKVKVKEIKIEECNACKMRYDTLDISSVREHKMYHDTIMKLNETLGIYIDTVECTNIYEECIDKIKTRQLDEFESCVSLRNILLSKYSMYVVNNMKLGNNRVIGGKSYCSEWISANKDIIGDELVDKAQEITEFLFK